MKNVVNRMMKPAWWGAGVVLGTSLLLSACGGDSSGNAGSAATCPTGTTVCGTAATGAPMANANVSLRCKATTTPSTTTADANGEWSYNVPVSNLPCAVKATDGTNTHFSVASSAGIANVSPLTSLALAQAAGNAPDDAWFSGLNDTDLATLASNLPAAVAALNTLLANYALPAGFNPVSTPLVAATSGQAGNAYDNLLEQFKAALGGGDFASLLNDFADYETGDASPLPAPSYTPAAADKEAFFTTFAGDYTLKVTNSGGEASSGAAAKALFPKDKALTMHIKANGDVVFDAVGKTITYAANTYVGNTTGTFPMARTAFSANELGKNVLRYWDSRGSAADLYLTYDPSNGKLSVWSQGFIPGTNDYSEGFANLEGIIFVPPAALPPVTPVTCSSGDNKLVFTNAPSDFCGFTREDSTGHPTHNRFYQFTSTDDTHGTTFVAFHLASDDTFETISITNSHYAYGCGDITLGEQPCSGVTVLRKANSTEFLLEDAELAGTGITTGKITVNGLLIHPVGSSSGSGSGDTALAATISAPFAGTYKLSCYTDSSYSALVERTIVVNADGTSSLDGDAVIASGHGGRISYAGGWGSANSSSEYEVMNDLDGRGISFKLRFAQDGSFIKDSIRSHSVYINGTGGTCTGISGPDMGAALGKTELATLVGSYALTDTLSCVPDSGNKMPTGSTTISIDSDGTLRLGDFSLAPAQYAVDDKRFTIGDAVSFPPASTALIKSTRYFTLSGDVAGGSEGSSPGSFFIQFDKDKKVTPTAVLYMSAPYSNTVCTSTP